MARTTYQISLSVRGDHRVTGTTDDPKSFSEVAEQTKNLMGWLEYYVGQGTVERVADVPRKDVPNCPVHGSRMRWSERTVMWYCPRQDGDGSYCRETISE
jgi:hypothetical protein